MPARLARRNARVQNNRGRVDIWINGSYWAGAILGSFVSYIFLNHFAPNVGWRLAFLLGPVLALVVIIVGRVLPESPRWLVTHGRQEEADKVMAKIEEAVRKSGQELGPIDEDKAIEIVPETRYGYLTFLKLVFHQYPRRAILGATLMITQSFRYGGHRPRLLRRSDRQRLVQDRAVRGIPDRRCHHAGRRPSRGVPGRQRRRQITRAGH
jgi:MFS family permease